MKRYLKSFKSFDIFGGFVSFRVNDRNKLKSYLGAFMTILVGVLFVVLCLLFSKDLIEKINPRLNLIRSYNPENIEIQLLNSSTINLVVQLCKIIEGKCVYQFDNNLFDLTSDHSTVKSENNSRKYDFIPINFKTCQKEDFHTKLQTKFDELSFARAYCLNANNSTISGQYESKIFKYIRIRLMSCVKNATNTCLNKTQIEDQIGLWRMSLYFSFDLENVYNYEIPFEKQLSNNGFTLSLSSSKRTNIFLQKNTVSSDENYFLENKTVRNHSLISYDGKSDEFEQNSLDKQIIFASVFLRVSPMIYIFNRSYKKISVILAEVAGLLNNIVLLIIIIFSFYNKFNLKLHLFNNNFDLNVNESNLDRDIYLKCSDSVFEDKTLDERNTINSLSMSIISKNKKNKVFKKKFNCLEFLIDCCRFQKKNKNILREIYNKVDDMMINQLELNCYLGLLNKFNYLSKMLLDEEQYILFNNLNFMNISIDENNNFLSEEFIFKQKNKKSLIECFVKISSKREKSKIDLFLLDLNRNII